ncbi:polyhydroxyalkanoic acid synthase [Caenimonas sedimenti]|uniref:Polyhydroxyalkanoic acid synthase n=1 Tax=Caenimonas sedimenti TaxID=2596921 RepID=A0A562ZHW2_9BURK|nr:polyhydroxyalkanoic acid system family protein [Caenimonas sedimenti]TWO67895.1 polyhydroxyalkanoic acid synthase [Caenimonas sedimenti]
MPDIHITREHSLGLAQARELAFRWAETAEAKLDMECTYEEGKTSDLVSFKRPGASGELKVTKDSFVLDARLGLLLGIFKDKIESAIVENLDALLQEKEPLKAFDKGLAKHEAKHDKPARKAAAKPVAKSPAKAPAAKKK